MTTSNESYTPFWTLIVLTYGAAYLTIGAVLLASGKPGGDIFWCGLIGAGVAFLDIHHREEKRKWIEVIDHAGAEVFRIAFENMRLKDALEYERMAYQVTKEYFANWLSPEDTDMLRRRYISASRERDHLRVMLTKQAEAFAKAHEPVPIIVTDVNLTPEEIEDFKRQWDEINSLPIVSLKKADP